MQTHTATYFNGIDKTGHEAKFRFDPLHIFIDYRDANGRNQLVQWDVKLLHSVDFSNTQHVFLKHGKNPTQYLEVTGAAAVAAICEHYELFKLVKKSNIEGLLLHAVVAGILLVVAFLLLAYFFILPEVMQRVADNFPIEWEQKIGNTFFEQSVDAKTIDADKSIALNRFFDSLNFMSRYDVQLTFVNEDVVNAFALPGGRIVVYSGIIQKMKRPEELAALLSHEFSHVELKHTTKGMLRDMSSSLLIALLLGDHSGIAGTLAQNADALNGLHYSRELEREADKNGLKLLRENHLDPEGMLDLFEALKEEEVSTGTAGVPSFMNTHPLTEERIKFVREEIDNGTFNTMVHPMLDTLWLQLRDSL